ncbi:hypothetical protein Y037_1822 [Burkholderia pseudomallei MSHR983]|nr:hypothetical protein Y037_1822 [Burkholderia pseudomallei MSHR983]
MRTSRLAGPALNIRLNERPHGGCMRFDLARKGLDYLRSKTCEVGRCGVQRTGDLIEIAANSKKSAVRRRQLLKLPLSELR